MGLPAWLASQHCAGRNGQLPCMGDARAPGTGRNGQEVGQWELVVGAGSLPHRAKPGGPFPGCGWYQARITWPGQTGTFCCHFLEAAFPSPCVQPKGPWPPWVKDSYDPPVIFTRPCLRPSPTLCPRHTRCPTIAPASGTCASISSPDTHMAHSLACFSSQMSSHFWGGHPRASCHMFLLPIFSGLFPTFFSLLSF